jgi:hypothetical protein
MLPCPLRIDFYEEFLRGLAVGDRYRLELFKLQLNQALQRHSVL